MRGPDSMSPRLAVAYLLGAVLLWGVALGLGMPVHLHLALWEQAGPVAAGPAHATATRLVTLPEGAAQVPVWGVLAAGARLTHLAAEVLESPGTPLLVGGLGREDRFGLVLARVGSRLTTRVAPDLVIAQDSPVLLTALGGVFHGGTVRLTVTQEE